ncbi:MAG: tetratricopeptide repeat protein [Acidobacteria bacterium]|nr:tetratricopeptide repeat protein [Acidobacteriota bacterium]
MTAGIPGAGIGGLFYLLSALWMPFREGWLAAQGRSTAASRAVVRRQVAIAVGILASLWAAAWLLSAVIAAWPAIASMAGAAPPSAKDQELPRLLSYSALAFSLATLAIILAGVQLLRLIVRPKPVSPREARPHSNPKALKDYVSATQMSLFVLLVMFHPIACAQSSQSVAARHVANADAALAAKDTAAAEREYRAALASEPNNSRAAFRLAQLLQRSNPAEAEQLFRRYVRLEPADPWGYITLAEFFTQAGRYDSALEWYAEAVRRAPAEREAALGQARTLGRSGHTDQAIRAYEQWLQSHPNDDEAWRELARENWRAGRPESARLALQRAIAISSDEELTDRLEYFRGAAAPAIEPQASFSWDSDGNARQRLLVGGDFAVADGVRLGAQVGRTRVSDDLQDRSFNQFAGTAHFRPRAAFLLRVAAGAVRLDSGLDENGLPRPAALSPTADVLARFSAPGGAARLDARFNRTLLDATPALVANRVIRNEFRIRPDFTVARRLHLRAVGGIGSIRGAGERNSRYTAGGGAGWNIRPAVELSANYAQIHYPRPSRAGYFAPDRIHSVEGGSYMEFESSAALVALDLGAGAERLQEHGAVSGPWRASLRGYALLSFPLRAGRELRFEIEGYDTQAGPVVAPTAGWKYGSAAVSFRWPMP